MTGNWDTTGRVVMASVLPAFKMTDPGYWASWLGNAEQIRTSHPGGVEFMVVLEVDGRGRAPFQPLLDRLRDLAGHVWTFSVDDGATTLTSHNRLMRICTGRNLISHFAVDHDVQWVLFADADTAIPADALPKLLDVEWPIVGGRVPTYCLEGETPEQYFDHHWNSGDMMSYAGSYPPHPDFPLTPPFTPLAALRRAGDRVPSVRVHMNTAGFLLVHRDLFTRLRWRTDLDNGHTDDPCYDMDARALGYPTLVREDCVAVHYPESIPPLEYRGHDLAIHR